MDAMGARERLEAVIEASGVKTKKEFARKTGVSESTISQITSTSPNSRQSEISEETARKIVASLPELRLSMVWLVSGKGEMRVRTPESQPSLFTGVNNTPDVAAPVASPESSDSSSFDDSGDVHSAISFDMASGTAEDVAGVMAAGFGGQANTQKPSLESKPQKPRLERIVMFYSDGTFVEYRPKE